MKAENIVFENKKKHDAQADEKNTADTADDDGPDGSSREDESDKQ